MPTRYPEYISSQQGSLDKDDCYKNYYTHVCDQSAYKVDMQKVEIKPLTCELKRVTQIRQHLKEENEEKT